jgi:hypothetical protein
MVAHATHEQAEAFDGPAVTRSHDLRIQGTDHLLKETAVSNVKIENVQGTARVETSTPVALLDCGEASKVTKGFPYFWYYEPCTPPFDTMLM